MTDHTKKQKHTSSPVTVPKVIGAAATRKPSAASSPPEGGIARFKNASGKSGYDFATPQGTGHIDVVWADTFGGVYRANNIVTVPPYLSPMAREKFWRGLQQAVAEAIYAALDAVEDGGEMSVSTDVRGAK